MGWRGEGLVAATILIAITLSMIIACLLGVAVPAVLRAAKADPKIAAGPVVLASADVVTLLLYFGLGTRSVRCERRLDVIGDSAETRLEFGG